MKKIHLKNNSGFTLVEALVYLVLFGILMGGGIVAAYNIFESGSRNSAKVIVQEEGNFLLGKIAWALSSITGINAPAVSTTGSKLIVTAIDPLIGAIDIELGGPNNTDVLMTRGGITQTLNNSNVEILNLIFDHENNSGAEYITASFSLNIKTADGKILTQTFKATKYIRK